MKVVFLFVCLVCGVAVSLLVFIMTSGMIPFRTLPAPAPVAGSTGGTNASDTAETDVARINVRIDMAEDMLKELGREKEALARRGGELEVRAERIRLQEAAIVAMRKDLDDLKQALRSNLVEVAAVENDNLKRISDVCSKMEPASASQMLLELSNERAATILGLVNERAAAKIMDAAIASGTQGAKRVAEWTDILRRLRIGKDVPKEIQT